MAKRTENRRLYPALLAGLLCLALLAAGSAQAGWWGKDKQEKSRKTLTHRFNRFPTLTFSQGMLSGGGMGWRLDDKNLYLSKSCMVSEEGGADGYLQSGRQAIVAGTVMGDMIVATHIKMLKPDWMSQGTSGFGVQKEASESNPNVGILKQAPR